MSGPVAVLDTSVFVSAKVPDEPEHSASAQLLELAHLRRFRAIVSTVTVSELSAGYHRVRDDLGRRAFLDYVRSAGTIEAVSVDVDVADEAARIRSETALRLPDALIVATGIRSGAECIVTHHRGFARAKGRIRICSAREYLRRLGPAQG